MYLLDILEYIYMCCQLPSTFQHKHCAVTTENRTGRTPTNTGKEAAKQEIWNVNALLMALTPIVILISILTSFNYIKSSKEPR
jgi:hypothetical protein